VPLASQRFSYHREARSRHERGSDAAAANALEEFVELSKEYVKQETLDPLKSMGRRLGFGVLGAVCVGMGSVMLGVGLLRAVTRFVSPTTKGALSAAPYLVAGIGLVGFLALAWKFAFRAWGRR
jgi:hypothetical protein